MGNLCQVDYVKALEFDSLAENYDRTYNLLTSDSPCSLHGAPCYWFGLVFYTYEKFKQLIRHCVDREGRNDFNRSSKEVWSGR